MSASFDVGAPAATPEREAAFARVRAELRAGHRRLTDEQVDLIADVAVELRLARVRLGLEAPPTSS